VNSGFPFLVNADFILSTSRESIQFGRPWNRWLRDCIALTFVQAFESLLNQPKHRFRVYHYVPLIADIQESFFHSAIGAIYSELRDRAVVWSFDGETLVKPLNARFAPKAFRELLAVSNHTPAQLCETPLVHPEITHYRKQLQAIGVKDLSDREIITCLEDESWLESQNLEWFIALYEYLSQQSWATEWRLQELKLLPLEEGERSNAEHPIYFPAENVQEIRQLQPQASSIFPIAFLNLRLYELIHDNQSLIQWLTETLGVRKLTLANYCLDLARMLNRHRAEVSTSDLVRLTVYIRDQFDALDDETQQAIIDVLPLALADGEIVKSQQWNDDHPLVMPQAMDPKTGWQLVFADPEDLAHMAVLSDTYLADCSEEDFHKWRDFFEAMGATDAPLPRRKRWEWSYSRPADITDHARKFLRTAQDSTRECRLQDWIAPQRLRRLDTDQLDEWTERRCFALLEWLERRVSQSGWMEPLFYRAEYEWHYYSWHSKRFDSEFKYCLLNAPWFPSTQGLKRPGEVLLDKPELRELFGDAVPYALGNPSEKVANWLELRQTATADELLQYLKELGGQSADQVDQKVVRKIYAFLSERWRPEIKEQFEEYPLIFVSKPQPRWVTADQAVWPDLAAVFGETYIYLEKQYERRFKEFFVEKVGVAEQLSQELYVQAWTHLTKAEDIQADAVEAALERIYPELLKVAQGDTQPQWWQRFCTDAEVWTQNDRFKFAGRVYVPDDGELKRLFAKKDVEFAWRPEKASFAEYQPLYRALGIRSLVDTVEDTAKEPQVTETDGFQPFLTLDAKQAICFYLWNVSHYEYERAKQAGILEALLRTQERMVKSLTVSYKLNWTTVEVPNSSAYWQRDKCLLYRSDAHSQDQLEVEIPAVLARRLTGGRSSNALEDFIGRVLGASEVKAEGIIRKHNWSLPAEEREWMNGVLASSVRPESEPGSESELESEVRPELESELQLEPESESKPEPGPEPESKPKPELKPGPRLEPKPRPELDRRRPRLDSSIELGSTGGAPEKAISAILGDQGADRAAMPYTEPERPTGAGALGSDRRPSPKGKPRGKLRSYVIHDHDETKEERDTASAKRRSEVDQAGIEHVLEHERACGRTPTVMPHHHKGYDIESLESEGGMRYIEVKSLSGEWGERNAAGLTRTQFETARSLGDQFWLYVVERATSDEPQLYPIQDPANRVNQYLFDDGWQVLAEIGEAIESSED
jgi:hypothetical protein